MRIRSIKPEFWRSEDITRLPFDLRLLFIGLWSYVDDNGVGIDDYRRITADLFALEDDLASTRVFVNEGLRRLCEGSLLTRYMIDSKPYLFINGWSQHQRVPNPNLPRYPLPNGLVERPASGYRGATDGVVRTYVDPNEDLGTGTGEQGNRGTGEVERTSFSLAHPPASDAKPKPSKPKTTGAYSDEFEQWWSLYPRKVDKHPASKAFATARKTTAAPVLADAVRRYATEVEGKDAEHIKHAKTWLSQRCWMNYGPDIKPAAPTPDTAADWLRAEWTAGRVSDIEKRTGLRYERPDLPDHVSGREASERWAAEHLRQWITDNRDEIISRLTTRAAS